MTHRTIILEEFAQDRPDAVKNSRKSFFVTGIRIVLLSFFEEVQSFPVSLEFKIDPTQGVQGLRQTGFIHLPIDLLRTMEENPSLVVLAYFFEDLAQVEERLGEALFMV